MKHTSRDSLTLSHGSNDAWEGTFQLLLTTLLADILRDGPADVSLTREDGTEVAGRLMTFGDDHIDLDTIGGAVRIDRATVLAFTLE